MAQNENNRNTSSRQEDLQNQDQTSQRRQTDSQNQQQRQNNPTSGKGDSKDTKNSNDRGISGMSDMDADNIESGAENRNDSLNRDRDNTSR